MIEWTRDRVWYQDMPLKRYGVPVGARMTVIRFDEDQLLVHSPIELTVELQLALAKLGRVTVVVTPNLNHHLFLSEWWLTYPDARFYAPPGLESKRTDLDFDDALGATTPELWRHKLYQTIMRGSDRMEEIVFCDPISRTLILGDTLAWFSGIKHPLSLGLALLNGCYHQPAMPYYWRSTFNNKTRLRQSIQEVLTWPFDRIILAHGKVIEEDGKQRFFDAFKWAFQD